MTRKRLDGAQTVSNWTTIAGALQGIVAYLGAPIDQPSLMGLTGHAFRLDISGGDSGTPARDSNSSLDFAASLPLYESLGFRWDCIIAGTDEPDFDRRRRDAVKRIRRSIDAGRPVAAYGLHLEEFGVIKGYDDRSEHFFVSTTLSPQYGETLALGQWPAPGHESRLIVLIPGKRISTDLLRAQLTALAFARTYAAGGEGGLIPGSVHGLAAYDRWQAAYEIAGGLNPLGNALCIQTLQSARRDAARFLRSLAPSWGSSLSLPLERAASAYEAEALELSRLASLFPYPSGGDTDSNGTRAAGAAALRRARQSGSEAVDQVTVFLEEHARDLRDSRF